MPTPIGHSLAGLTVQLASGKGPARHQITSALLVVIVASLPDLDFIPGYLSNEPRAFHWGPTHSLFAAVVVGCAFGCFARYQRRSFTPVFLLMTAVYASHLLLDCLLGPGAPSIGLQVFWPFNTDRWMLPWAVFRMAPDTMDSMGPVGTLFSWEILPVVGRELLILGPALLLAGIAALLRVRAEAGRQEAGRASVTAGTSDVATRDANS